MKIADIRNPVRFSWLTDQGLRLAASPYLSGTYEAKRLLERLPGTRALHELTAGHDGGIYNGPKFRRNYVNDPEHGVPFLGSTDIMEADFTNIPLLLAKDALSDRLSYLRVEPGMTLISCSGTVGRMCYVRPDMAGFWSSQDVLKIVADKEKILSGYLYAFLSSQFGVPIVTSQAYGSIIPHLEPVHIADLPVPRFPSAVEEEIHGYVQAAADLRAEFQVDITAATRDLFESAHLPELLDLRWNDQSREIGFTVNAVSSKSLRAVNYGARARSIIAKISSVPHRTVGDICRSGRLSTGPRFKRIDSDSENGILLVGQRQGFWTRPEGRWISPNYTPNDVFVDDETVMVAEHGLVGETALICRAILVSGAWIKYAYTQDFLRVRSGMEGFPGAYLFAFMRSEAAFRALRSMLVGTGPQEISIGMLQDLPVPECTPADRERIAETVRRAYRARDEADELEDRAQELLDAAMREASADLRLDSDLTHRPRKTDGRGRWRRSSAAASPSTTRSVPSSGTCVTTAPRTGWSCTTST